MVTPLVSIQNEISNCENFRLCNSSKRIQLSLSKISGGDPRRGNPKAKILLVTESPDLISGQGGAYSGSIAKRIMNLFVSRNYEIYLDYPSLPPQEFERFLTDNLIYVTSAVKCVLTKVDKSNLNYRIIDNCRIKFLKRQIEALTNLEFIIPLGAIAASAVLHKIPSTYKFGKLVGSRGSGIIRKDSNYGKTIIVLPHPSGKNPFSNPPIPSESDNLNIAKQKLHFRNALQHVRAKLSEMGYSMRPLSILPTNSELPYF